MNDAKITVTLVVLVLFGLVACSGQVQEIDHTPSSPSATITLTQETPPIPSATIEPAASLTVEECTERKGRLVSLLYPAKEDGQLTSIRAYLPPCYPQERDYPTLYALHGLRSNNQQWIELGLREVMDEKIVAGDWPPFMVAMPFLREPLFTGTDGGEGSYEQEFQEAVIPYFERRFEADSARAIAGISRGGLWALEIAFRDGDSFRSVVALSPSLHVNLAAARYDPLRMPLPDLSLPPGIYLGMGDRDPEGLQALELLSDRLEQHGAEHQLIVKPGGHDNALWMLFLEEVLQFVVERW